mgnify:CR=1 FL=1|jgi:putative FmdB family regulatory protein
MPIFDYTCRDCGKNFDIMISNNKKDQVRCPECASKNVKQKLSVFNTGAKPSVGPGNACQGCGMGAAGG